MSNARHARTLAVAAAGLVAASVAAGVGLATTGGAAPVGSGVVVIETSLGYQGGRAAGTGMVLTRSGEILTNNHVVQGATTIRAVVPGSGRSYAAKVVGYDVADDVAVLQATKAANLKTVSTSGSAVRVGAAVKAVGNANGTGTLATVAGKVTAVGRTITVADDQGGSESLGGMIQTNANLQPGDSGGPLYDAAGKVVGMDTAASATDAFVRATTTESFAIPIAKALSIAKQIESGTSSTRVHVGGTAFVGVQVQPTLGAGGTGVLVTGILPGGAAEAAGLTAGDVLTAIDGRPLASSSALTSAVLAKKPGDKATLTYVDPLGTSHTTQVTLGSGPAQ